nr:hypothetical protein [Neobacillus sp. 179.-C4.2 HS]
MFVEDKEVTSFNTTVEENRVLINVKEITENTKVEIRFAYTPSEFV